MKQATNDISTAKRLIARESPTGLRLLGAGVSRPCAPARYDLAATAALADGDAQFSRAERELIASFISDGGETDNRSGYTLRVRLNESERVTLERLAADAGIGLSEYVRRELGL